MDIRKKRIKASAKDYVSVNYQDCLAKLATQVEHGDALENPLVVPFILTCAAALEAKLNDEIISWAWDTFDREDYKRIAVAYLSMNLRGKLDSLVPLISKNLYAFDKSSKDYQALTQLISQRNSLVHDKSFYEEVTIEIERDEGIVGLEDARIRFPDGHLESLMKSPYRTANAKECQQYYKAIKALDEKFLYLIEKGELKDNDMIKRVK